jgi:3-dehydroquinate dehydratase-2
MSKPIYVLSGPNLNLLGTREPEIYGRDTLEDVRKLCEARAKTLGREVVFRQSNHEGELIDWIQEAREKACAIVINPAGYGHTSVAILDALKAAELPVVECHLSNPAAREDFRRYTYVSLAATGLVSGFGAKSYELAVEAAADLVSRSRSSQTPVAGADELRDREGH